MKLVNSQSTYRFSPVGFRVTKKNILKAWSLRWQCLPPRTDKFPPSIPGHPPSPTPSPSVAGGTTIGVFYRSSAVFTFASKKRGSRRGKEKNEVETEKIRKYGGNREVTRMLGYPWSPRMRIDSKLPTPLPPLSLSLSSSVNPSERFTPDVREVRKRNGSFGRGKENEGRKIGE